MSGGEVTCLYRRFWHCRECVRCHAGSRWGRSAWGTPQRQNSAGEKEREDRDSFVSAAVQTSFPVLNPAHDVKWTQSHVNKRWPKTHMEDDAEDWLEDDDVAVARSLGKLLLLLHVLLLVVDVLIVLLRHPACVGARTCVRHERRNSQQTQKINILLMYSQVRANLRPVWVCTRSPVHSLHPHNHMTDPCLGVWGAYTDLNSPKAHVLPLQLHTFTTKLCSMSSA